MNKTSLLSILDDGQRARIVSLARRYFHAKRLAEWQQYQGPRDGKGWQNTETGEVVYQKEKPGRKTKGDGSGKGKGSSHREKFLAYVKKARKELGRELSEKIARRKPGEGGKVELTRQELSKVLKSGVVGFVSAGINPNDPKDSKLSESEVKQRYDTLKADLKELGFMYAPIVGHYGDIEDSFAIMANEPSKEDIISLGIKYNQDSVLYSVGNRNELIYTTGQNYGKANPGVGWKETPEAEDFFSVFNLPSGEEFKFSLNLNFDELKKSVLLALARLGWIPYE